MAIYKPDWMLEFRSDWMLENRLSWLCENRRNWLMQHYMELLTGYERNWLTEAKKDTCSQDVVPEELLQILGEYDGRGSDRY